MNKKLFIALFIGAAILVTVSSFVIGMNSASKPMSDIGNNNDDNPIPTHTHIESEWIIDKEPTSVEEGKKHTECIICHQIMSEETISGVASVGIAYSVNSDKKTCTITGKGTCNDKDIIIPSTIDGYKVTAIKEWAFQKLSITSVTIPNTVTRIGEYAFSECTSLKTINIPNSVTYIDDLAFYKCSSLAEITIPNAVTTISYGMFSSCASLSKITFGENVNTIESNAFKGCTSLHEVHISDIKKWCKINIVDKDASPLDDAKLYINNELVVDLIIPEGVTSIGALAFWGCSSIVRVTLPSTLNSVGSDALEGCRSLVEVCNKSSLTVSSNYNERADVHVSNANHIFKNESESYLKYKGDYIFYDDGVDVYLTKYIGSDSNITLPNYDNGKQYKIYCDAFRYNTSVQSVVIPHGVTAIDGAAFADCTLLKSVTIPNSVTSIGGSAFENCTSLASANIPDSVTSIGSSAFENCESLTNVIIPDGVTKIEEYTFYGCSSITSLTIGKNVREIEDYAFYNCYSMFEIRNKSSLGILSGYGYHGYVGYYARYIITNSTEAYYKNVGDFMFYENGNTIKLLSYKGNDTHITLPIYSSGKKYVIDSKAFSKNKKVESITIPSNVTSIGESAFSGCTSLISITIPNSVTSIGEGAFYECASLTSITLPNSITSIGSSTFSGCTSLKNITIPSSVTSIGDYAFYGCTSLTSVTFMGDVPSYTYADITNLVSVTLMQGVTSVDDNNAFEGCYSLVEVCNKSSLNITAGSSSDGYVGYYAKNITTDKSHIKYVGDYIFYDDVANVYLVKYLGTEKQITLPQYDNGKKYTVNSYAFYGNKFVEKITIPDCVMGIGDSVFNSCHYLKAIYIPSSVITMGKESFRNCHSSLQIYCEANSKPSGWAYNWNYKSDFSSSGTLTVVWGYKGE